MSKFNVIIKFYNHLQLQTLVLFPGDTHTHCIFFSKFSFLFLFFFFKLKIMKFLLSTKQCDWWHLSFEIWSLCYAVKLNLFSKHQFINREDLGIVRLRNHFWCLTGSLFPSLLNKPLTSVLFQLVTNHQQSVFVTFKDDLLINIRSSNERTKK